MMRQEEAGSAVEDRDDAVEGVKPSPAIPVPNLALGLRVQSLTGVCLSLLALISGPVAAYSVLAGGLAVYIPGLLFTLWVARRIGGDTAAFLRSAALAEVSKLALTGVLSAVVFVFVKPLAAGFFFLGMIGVLIASWVGLALAFRGP